MESREVNGREGNLSLCDKELQNMFREHWYKDITVGRREISVGQAKCIARYYGIDLKKTTARRWVEFKKRWKRREVF